MADSLHYDMPPRPAARCGLGAVGAIVVLLVGVAVGYVLRQQLGSVPVGGTRSSAQISGELLSHTELTALAEMLERNQLYGEAARAWESAARLQPPQAEARAECLFRIGKNLSLAHEHERALSYLFAAEAADDPQRWQTSINKLVLEGLSALGREDARTHQAARRIALADRGEDAPAVVADIGGEPITELDLTTCARRMITRQLSMQERLMTAQDFEQAVEDALQRFDTPENRSQLLQMVLSRELLYREALAADLPADRAVQQQLTDARRQILTEAFVTDYLKRNLQIAETDVRNAYEADKQDYVEPEAFKIQAVVVDAEEARDRASAALEAGADFTEVQAAISTLDTGGDQADPFDRWIPRDGRIPLAVDSRAALAHIASLEPGEVGQKWFEGQAGRWLRFRMTERRAPRQLTLQECRDRVEQSLRRAKEAELLQSLEAALKNKYQVVIHEPDLPPTTQEPAEESL